MQSLVTTSYAKLGSSFTSYFHIRLCLREQTVPLIHSATHMVNVMHVPRSLADLWPKVTSIKVHNKTLKPLLLIQTLLI